MLALGKLCRKKRGIGQGFGIGLTLQRRKAKLGKIVDLGKLCKETEGNWIRFWNWVNLTKRKMNWVGFLNWVSFAKKSKKNWVRIYDWVDFAKRKRGVGQDFGIGQILQKEKGNEWNFGIG